MTTSYNPEDIVVTFQGKRITGFAKGSFIQVDRDFVPVEGRNLSNSSAGRLRNARALWNAFRLPAITLITKGPP